MNKSRDGLSATKGCQPEGDVGEAHISPKEGRSGGGSHFWLGPYGSVAMKKKMFQRIREDILIAKLRLMIKLETDDKLIAVFEKTIAELEQQARERERHDL